MNTAEYERMYRLEDSYWWFVGRHRLIESLLRSYYGPPDNPESTLRLLDIGCGTGAMSARLARWGKVVSADFSPLALQFSRRRGLHNLVGADAMNLPFQGDQFDALVAMDMLEHLPDDNAALREFNRVLKPGGRVFATVPAYMHLWSDHDVSLMHHRRYVRAEMAERFATAGFKIEKLSHTMMLLYPVVAMQRRLNRTKSTLPQFAAPVNAALTSLFTAENAMAKHLNFPFGVTILCIARKKSEVRSQKSEAGV